MNKEMRVALLWAGILITVALIATYLRRQGLLDQDAVIRTVAMNGLMIIYYGNRAPKVAPHNAYAQHLARFSGWSSVLSGLVYAAFWAFAPISLAITIGTGAVALGMAATLAYWYRLHGRMKHTASK